MACKQTFDVIKVDAKIIDDLQKTRISDDVQEDKGCKKTIANINFGLLEKSKNKAQRSHIFNSLREACFYQHLYGGNIYSIGHEEEDLWWEDKGEGEELREKLLEEGTRSF